MSTTAPVNFPSAHSLLVVGLILLKVCGIAQISWAMVSVVACVPLAVTGLILFVLLAIDAVKEVKEHRHAQLARRLKRVRESL